MTREKTISQADLDRVDGATTAIRKGLMLVKESIGMSNDHHNEVKGALRLLGDSNVMRMSEDGKCRARSFPYRVDLNIGRGISARVRTISGNNLLTYVQVLPKSIFSEGDPHQIAQAILADPIIKDELSQDRPFLEQVRSRFGGPTTHRCAVIPSENGTSFTGITIIPHFRTRDTTNGRIASINPDLPRPVRLIFGQDFYDDDSQWHVPISIKPSMDVGEVFIEFNHLGDTVDIKT